MKSATNYLESILPTLAELLETAPGYGKISVSVVFVNGYIARIDTGKEIQTKQIKTVEGKA